MRRTTTRKLPGEIYRNDTIGVNQNKKHIDKTVLRIYYYKQITESGDTDGCKKISFLFLFWRCAVMATMPAKLRGMGGIRGDKKSHFPGFYKN